VIGRTGESVSEWAHDTLPSQLNQARDAVTPVVGQVVTSLGPLLESAQQARKDVTGLSRKTVRQLTKASHSARKDARAAVRQGIYRGSAAAAAWRDPHPPRRWPLAVGAFAVGIAMGVAVSVLSQRYVVAQATEEAAADQEFDAERTLRVETPVTEHTRSSDKV